MVGRSVGQLVGQLVGRSVLYFAIVTVYLEIVFCVGARLFVLNLFIFVLFCSSSAVDRTPTK